MNGSISSVSLVFWAFLIFVLAYPAIQKRILEASRLRILKKLERKRQSRVIALVHRQETMTFLGFPVMRYLTIEDSEEILRAIRLTPQDMPIDLILHTPGGLVLATEQISRALRRHQAKITVFVPHYAMSGGTLIALAAHELVMDDNAVLGPLDPQLGEYPAAALLRTVELKPAKELDDKTLILAEVARLALQQVKACVLDALDRRVPQDKAETIAAVLTEGKFTHDYPINVELLRELGLNVKTDVPAEVYQLMNLFPQAATNRPTVQYIPSPYQSEKRPSAPQKFTRRS